MTRTIDDLLKHLDGRLEEDVYISTVSEALYDLNFEDFFKGYTGSERPISVLHGIVFGKCKTEAEEENFADLINGEYYRMLAEPPVSEEDLKKMKFGNVVMHGEDRGVIRENIADVFVNLMCYPLKREKSL